MPNVSNAQDGGCVLMVRRSEELNWCNLQKTRTHSMHSFQLLALIAPQEHDFKLLYLLDNLHKKASRQFWHNDCF